MNLNQNLDGSVGDDVEVPANDGVVLDHAHTHCVCQDCKIMHIQIDYVANFCKMLEQAALNSPMGAMLMGGQPQADIVVPVPNGLVNALGPSPRRR